MKPAILQRFTKNLTAPTGPAAIAGRHMASAAKERVVILGSGWGGFQLALNLNNDVDVTVVSPRNHFVFTPLLPSAAVGTLECRCIQEPVRSVLSDNGHYMQAKARSLDHERKTVTCESLDNAVFELEYDKLVIAVGVKTNTFGMDSIADAARTGDSIFFLKQLEHARAIRSNIIKCFEKASIPTVSEAERRQLLSFLVVGGGPTSCEFTAELHDFVKQDVKRLYPDLLKYVKITLVEAGPALLGPFDKALQDYAHRLFRKRDIDVQLGTAVTGVEEIGKEADYRFPGAKRALLSAGPNKSLEFGTMVWSAGLAPRTFTASLDETVFARHDRTRRLLVDDYLRVQNHEGSIWAIGDAAINATGPPLPQLAQVARQQGIYLAKVFNKEQRADEKAFSFFSLGSMASVGEMKGIYDGSTVGPVRSSEEKKEASSWMSRIQPPRAIRGFSALLLWRFAYWGRQTSVVNKILIPMYWFKTMIFGRDTSRY